MSDPFYRRRSILTAGALLAITGCGVTVGAGEPKPEIVPVEPDPTPAKPVDPVPNDHGSVSTTYPAFKPSVAQLVNHGGPILKNPVVVSVTWSDDPNVATLESVGDTIGASSYWKDVVGEYGVGPATSGRANHVHLTTPLVLPTGPQADPVAPIITLITEALSNPTSGWPAPTAQSVYLVFIHGKAAKQLCDSGAGGLHDSLEVGGKEVPFAIAAACDSESGKSTPLEEATISASHELAEAATDPFPSTAPAWVGLHDDHLAWELLQMGQDENTDMCEFYEDAYGKYAAPQLPFHVSRSWSNASAAAGHAPCVPAAKGETNFNVAPLDAFDNVVADFAKSQAPFNPSSKGYVVPVGKTRKIALGLYTDGPTSGFELEAFESDPMDEQGFTFVPAATSTLTLALDKTSGQNGEKAYLSVTANKATEAKIQLVVVRSKLNGVSRFMPILIGTNGTSGGGASTPARTSSRDARLTRRFSGWNGGHSSSALPSLRLPGKSRLRGGRSHNAH